ncbi:aldehyde dehydrogenase [Nocardia sp. NPDC005825]|uniref:aldehyde dehydrogenase n=1 Tax=unclassified Nocardia TaxID=2637762 RepID=UPI003400BD4A
MTEVKQVETMEPTPLFIGGKSALSSGPATEVIEAATGLVIGVAGTAGLSDIDAAVAAARAAQPAWSALPAEERAEHLERFAAALAYHAEATATLVTRENGMPITLSHNASGLVPAGLLAMYAQQIRSIDLERTQPSQAGRTTVRRVPVGVVAAIAPWNYPQTLAMMKIAPALAAGCTVVFKAALETALDAQVFAVAAVEAGLPAGVLNIMPGGVEASRHLVSHPGIDKVAFTGSTPVGQAIAEACGRLLRPVTLELGGKSAAIVLDDADLDTLAEGLYDACFPNNGQTCYANTRLLVPASCYDQVVDLVTAVVADYTVGDPLDPATQIGPMVTAAHRDRVLGHIARGKADGARVTTGGYPVADRDGFFVKPTVFADVDNADAIAQQEIFGPVLSIIRYDGGDAAALTLANASDFGLAGTVWSADEERAMSVATRIHTGTVGINHYALDLGAPFGGVKASGYGRELGPEGLDAYLTYQSVYQLAQPR